MTSKISQNSTVSKVIDIIEKNYSNPDLTISQVANMLKLNPSFISREFKNKTGINYLKFLTSVRIEKAKELLLADTPINDIITTCGYINLSAFCRIFKQYTGLSMTAWIKQNKK